MQRKFTITVPESLPDPTGYHLIVLIPSVEEKSKGGIFLPDNSKDRERHASVIAYVAKMGPDAYTDPDKFPSGPWCNVGDWIVIKKYDGNQLTADGVEFRVLNDDTVLAVVKKPDSIGRIF